VVQHSHCCTCRVMQQQWNLQQDHIAGGTRTPLPPHPLVASSSTLFHLHLRIFIIGTLPAHPSVPAVFSNVKYKKLIRIWTPRGMVLDLKYAGFRTATGVNPTGTPRARMLASIHEHHTRTR
jgi:hypothetical protein